jgi:hypothetical protein
MGRRPGPERRPSPSSEIPCREHCRRLTPPACRHQSLSRNGTGEDTTVPNCDSASVSRCSRPSGAGVPIGSCRPARIAERSLARRPLQLLDVFDALCGSVARHLVNARLGNPAEMVVERRGPALLRPCPRRLPRARSTGAGSEYPSCRTLGPELALPVWQRRLPRLNAAPPQGGRQ